MNGFSVAFAHVRSSSRCLTKWSSILAWRSINFLIDVLLVHVSDMSCLKLSRAHKEEVISTWFCLPFLYVIGLVAQFYVTSSTWISVSLLSVNIFDLSFPR